MKKFRFLIFTGLCLGGITVLGTQTTNADTTGNTKKGSVIKSTTLSTKKIVTVPEKEKIKDSKGSLALSRGGSTQGNQVAAYTHNFIGSPYVWGAMGPKAFDCSGLTAFVYGKVGISLPHYTGSQFSMGSSVQRNDLKPGDLVFFNTYGPISHVGVYIGGGEFIHAPGSGKKVTISDINNGYYSSRYAGARRYLN